MQVGIFGPKVFWCWSIMYISPTLCRFCSFIVGITVAVIDVIICLKLITWPYMKLWKYDGSVSLEGFPVQNSLEQFDAFVALRWRLSDRAFLGWSCNMNVYLTLIPCCKWLTTLEFWYSCLKLCLFSSYFHINRWSFPLLQNFFVI